MLAYCDTCGKEIKRSASQIRRYALGKCYCSRKCLHIKGTKAHLERFFTNVEKTNYCWDWVGAINRCGYGLFGMDGRHVLAHRAIWEMVHGPIEPGKCVCHTCDNPKCVNPEHLWTGTHRDNMEDRDEKGRVAKGENSGNSKLTEKEVIEMRLLYSEGISRTDLAKKYGVQYPTVFNIIKRKLWRHVH